MKRLIAAFVLAVLLIPDRAGAASQTLYVFGDSITVGDGASSPQFAYGAHLALSKGWSLRNLAASGNTVVEQATPIYGTQTNTTDVYTYMIGTNDERFNGNDLQRLAMFQNTDLAELAWLAIANKTTGQSSSVSYTGTWAATPAYGGGVGRYSSTVGDSASTMISGSTIYIGYTIQNSNPGKFSLTVDGAPFGTFQTLAQVSIFPAAWSYAPAVIRVSGLSNGRHQVVLTVTTAGNAYFDWVGSTAAKARVYAANVIRCNSSGYSVGGNDSNVARYGEAIEQNVALLQKDGLLVSLVDVSSVIVPDLDLADGVHPNDRGHAHLEAAFLAAMR